MPQYLTTEEIAERFRTSPETVRYWRHIGTGPRSFKVGRRVLYDVADVEAWLERLREHEGAAWMRSPRYDNSAGEAPS